MIEMIVSGLSIDTFTNMPYLVLESKDGNTKMPIWIGLFEASAIATELEQIQLSRPMTHDLLCSIVHELGAKLHCVEIHDLRENTYYARLKLEFTDKGNIVHKEIDCRPSDAIAIALRLKAPIHVAPSVIERAKDIELSKNLEKSPADEKVTKEKWSEILENLAPEDFGKYKM